MAEKHFYVQKRHAESYLIPYLEAHVPGFRDSAILEVGCAEAGFLAALHDQGVVRTVGLELEGGRARIARARCPGLRIVVGDVTDDRIVERIGAVFDVIVMGDVIEHVSDRPATFANLSRLLKDGGRVYITFPPRFSAFAGHQQNARSFLRAVPYLHLLPQRALSALCRALREEPRLAESVKSNYRIGLSIRSFERYCARFHFRPVRRSLFLLRPIYGTRYGLRLAPRRTLDVPLVREVITLGCEYLLQKTAALTAARSRG